ncbi:Superoxide dismutase [Cu-Zn] [Nesidiocoris tenuis]|uniref:Superoxide dismutase [Cu-Zn] n=1 Tax=Nesidiocoris tenuis TaxID=355587 RepID=A0ABN7B3U9_9HEMI|nr:Superoxide dismutase [Cu-Zn] [Nesidiocoris tenuis]
MAESSSADNAELDAAAARADRAVAVMKGQKPGVSGIINFEQRTPKSPMRISGEISGLPPGKHGLAVHEFGDLSSNWRSAGNHFNPYKKEHGGPQDQIRHLGDLGNVEVDEDGVARIDFTDRWLSLGGRNNVLGRSIIIHELPDDLGKGRDRAKSKKTGNAGAGIAMGVIGVQKL